MFTRLAIEGSIASDVLVKHLNETVGDEWEGISGAHSDKEPKLNCMVEIDESWENGALNFTLDCFAGCDSYEAPGLAQVAFRIRRRELHYLKAVIETFLSQPKKFPNYGEETGPCPAFQSVYLPPSNLLSVDDPGLEGRAARA